MLVLVDEGPVVAGGFEKKVHLLLSNLSTRDPRRSLHFKTRVGRGQILR